MLGAKQVAQGRKGTGDDKKQVGVRCPPEIYRWIESGRGPRETDTDRVLTTIETVKEFEEAVGPRLSEVRAWALLEKLTLGQAMARLALEGLDVRRKGKR